MAHTRKNRSLNLFISLLLIAGFSLTGYSQSTFVTTRKQQFIAPDGSVLQLKGINLGNWLLPEGYMFKFESASSPRLIETVINQLIGEAEARRFWKTYRDSYITRDDIQFIKRAGFNSVRVPFNYRLLVNPETQKLEGAGYELLDRVVNWCKAEKLYVILDLHAAPGGQTGDNIDDSFGYPSLFESAESQELTISIWQTLAARYKDSPTIIGYDLLNEPIAHFFDTAYLNPKLEPLYKRIVTAIRKVDRHHLIFLGGAQWDSNFKIFGPPFDDKLAYTFHKYWTEPTEQVIQEYVEFSKRYEVPLWMGESGENTNEWIASFRKVLEKNGIGWCFWPYKKLDAPSCVAAIHQPADWPAVVAFANQPRATFEEVRKVRPPKAQISRALNEYLEAIKFSNCRINDGYLQALGLK
jgi:aryl-phospho-beta-D-glucosidase BglC (GH1 family)